METNSRKGTINPKNIFFKFGTFLIALSLILNCQTIWLSSKSLISFKSVFIILLIGVLLSLGALKNNVINNKSLKKYVILVLLFGVYILVWLLQKSDIHQVKGVVTLSASFFLIATYSFFFINNTDIPLLVKYYINLMVVIGIISLYFWLLGSIFKIVAPTGYIISHWSTAGRKCLSYYGMYFETQAINGFMRNSSIFAEAPMASLNFAIALTFQTLINKNDKYHLGKSVVLILCILSTFSITGYLILVILGLYKLIIGHYKYKPLVLGLVLVSLLLSGLLVTKKLSTNAGMTRIDDFKAGYEAWKTHPIMGDGINTKKYMRYMSHWRRNNLGFSTTLMGILVRGGLYIGLAYILDIIISFIISLKNKNLNNVMFIMVISYLFITTMFIDSYILFFVFIFMGLNSMVKTNNS